MDIGGDRDPWIEIYNAGTNAVPLDGFYLSDNYSNVTSWAFPAGTMIEGGEWKVIFADGEPLESSPAEWHTGFRLSGGSGSVVLARPVNGAPQVLDYVNYAGIGAGRSYGSFPDGQPFVRQEFYYVTAGSTNNGASAPAVVFINEWMAENTGYLLDVGTGQYEDWFELFNPTDVPADIGGYFLTDTLASPNKYQVPPGYTVPARGFLLVWADSRPSANNSNSAVLHANFKLDREGEAIGLFSPEGVPIDTVAFNAQTANVSEGRYPDGAGRRFSMTTPTAGAANFIANTPPMLAAISNQVITLGQTLAFTVSATDTDQPPQSLSFSLGPGAPGNAMLTTGGGEFSWTPATAPLSVMFSVLVADSGTPSLIATQSFSVTVHLPPQLEGVTLGGNEFTFLWQSMVGQTIQVESTDDLAGIWAPRGDPIAGTGGPIPISYDLGDSAQRFFRLRVLP
jgi:hypothetical protein